MNETALIDLLRRRRSIRRYLPQAIEPEKTALLQEAALRAPSSRNLQPWRFIFCDDRKLIAQLARAKAHGSAFLAGAPLAVIVLGDESISDVWIEDCAIAAIILQLTAQSLGLGSCWVQIRLRPHDEKASAEAFVQNLFSLPLNMRVACIIGIGYPAEKPAAIAVDQLPWPKISDHSAAEL